MQTGTTVRAVMAGTPMGTGTVSHTDAEGLVWVRIGETLYPFYPHELS